ncbi:hypothetical protein LOTGIDRAFT_125466, partial [Lottia gigantea]
PDERSGHRIVVTDANLYSIGGYNPNFWDEHNDETTYYPLFRELWKFNFATRLWTQLETQSTMPYELASHTVVLDRCNMLMFGGTAIPFGESNSNDLNVCNLSTASWKLYTCYGDLPTKKYGHAMSMQDDLVFVVGGTSGYRYNMDVHQLNLKTLKWTQLSGKEYKSAHPESRYRHEIVYRDRELYLIGGGTAIEQYSLDKIPVFHTVNLKWKELKTKPDPIKGFPAPRKCHSCMKLNNEIYICGGLLDRKIADDIWKLNLVTIQWTKLSAFLPQPVYFHAASVTSLGCMYIFGGVSKIDVERTNGLYKIWLKIPPLTEMCWQLLCDTIDMKYINSEKLLDMGVPSLFVDRLSTL